MEYDEPMFKVSGSLKDGKTEVTVQTCFGEETCSDLLEWLESRADDAAPDGHYCVELSPELFDEGVTVLSGHAVLPKAVVAAAAAELRNAWNRNVEKTVPPPQKRIDYDTYMNSPQWAQKRNMVIQRCGGVCEDCGTARVAHVHHLTYVRFGNELPSDLKGLCIDCHQAAHPNRKLEREWMTLKSVSVRLGIALVQLKEELKNAGMFENVAKCIPDGRTIWMLQPSAKAEETGIYRKKTGKSRKNGRRVVGWDYDAVVRLLPASMRPVEPTKEKLLSNTEMADWFLSNYMNPVDGVPYDTEEGGFQYLCGGPYDAMEVLWSKFPKASAAAIDSALRMIDDRSDGNYEWAKADQY
jgi:5-methylcytosine-specific restriction endonuclease McrA